MAEILGAVASGVTVAGLFASCIEIFAIISTQHNASDEHVVLSTQLKIEQCRLYAWGQRLGLDSYNSRRVSTHKQIAIFDGTPFVGIIQEALQAIPMLFENTSQITNRYGCVNVKANRIPKQAQDSRATDFSRAGPYPQCTDPDLADDSRTPPPGPRWQLDCTDAHTLIQQRFHDFRVSDSIRSVSKMKLKGRIRWTIGDGQKFRQLVTDVRGLINGLESLSTPLQETNIPSLNAQVNMQMAKISDPETLSLIEEAASQYHPDLSETASVKLYAMQQTRNYSEGNRISKADTTVEKWMTKQNDMKSIQSNRRHFISQETWMRYALQAKSDLDDIARNLYGKEIYSLENQELDSIKGLYWKAVSEVLDPQGRAYTSMQEKRAKPYFLRRL